MKNSQHVLTQDFHTRLAVARALRSLSVRELSDSSSVAVSTISEMENAHNLQPSIAACAALAGGLEVSPLWLAYGVGDGPTVPTEIHTDPVEYHWWAYAHSRDDTALRFLKERAPKEKNESRYLRAIAMGVSLGNAGQRPLCVPELSKALTDGEPRSPLNPLVARHNNLKSVSPINFYFEAYSRINACRAVQKELYLMDMRVNAYKDVYYRTPCVCAVAIAAWDVTGGRTSRTEADVRQTICDFLG